MSHQSRRRRSYGRREHEVRERRQRNPVDRSAFDESADDELPEIVAVPISPARRAIVPVHAEIDAGLLGHAAVPTSTVIPASADERRLDVA